LIPLPWLLGRGQQTWALIALIGVASAPGTLVAIAFNALFADVVPPDWRAFIVGRRNALLAISLTVTSLLCGLLLDRIRFPMNYQVIFALGAAGAALSSYHIGRLRTPAGGPPPRVGRPIQGGAIPGMLRFVDALRGAPGLRFLTRSSGRRLLRFDLLRSSFGPFLAAYFLFYMFQYVPVALFPLFWVHVLGLSDGDISLGNALFYSAMLLSSLALRRVSRRVGHGRVLILGSAFYGLYPFLTSLAHEATLFWIASLVGGGVWGILNGGLVNRLMERVPEDDRPGHMALHNLVLNLGILLGSFAGPLVGRAVGLREALLVAAGLRLLAGLALMRWA
jgi:predicted MFS family arabinose efflux permease